MNEKSVHINKKYWSFIVKALSKGGYLKEVCNINREVFFVIYFLNFILLQTSEKRKLVFACLFFIF